MRRANSGGRLFTPFPLTFASTQAPVRRPRQGSAVLRLAAWPEASCPARDARSKPPAVLEECARFCGRDRALNFSGDREPGAWNNGQGFRKPSSQFGEGGWRGLHASRKNLAAGACPLIATACIECCSVNLSVRAACCSPTAPSRPADRRQP